VSILSENPNQIERLNQIFSSIEGHRVKFTPLSYSLHEGFTDHNSKICLYTDHQIFDRYHRVKTHRSVEKSERLTINDLNSFQIGDYIVHIEHGVGVFGGLVKTNINGKVQEAVKLIYRDGDVIFLSIHGLHRISRYKSKDSTAPKVYKLGTGAWNKLKSQAKSKVKDIAADLIELYAKRRDSRGFAFSPDTYMQHELEASKKRRELEAFISEKLKTKRPKTPIKPSQRIAEINENKAYKKMGISYIKFAKDYPEFFKIIFMQKTDLNIASQILFEDNHLLVIEKPVGIPVQADSSNAIDLITILKEYRIKKENKKGDAYIGLVHRLDRPVGGIMVFAKTSKAASRLSDEIRKNNFHKTYYAVVEGTLPKEGKFEDYLIKNEKENISYVSTKEKGKYSCLEYTLISSKNNLSLVKINLITGRSHQIRVQFSSRHHPLVGDSKYGNNPKNIDIALFAQTLTFTHPTTKEVLTFNLDLPNRYPFNMFK
jgi:RluA family pseudouridine synthase